MLVAYLDEFGHQGPYFEDGHPRYGHHPIFGFAGYIVPASNARAIGAAFNQAKNQLFKTEIETSANPAQWERKGSEYFTTGSVTKRPEQLRVFRTLLDRLRACEGKLFYYGDEKRRGTLKQTKREPVEIMKDALRESINRICRYAEGQDQDVLIIADELTQKTEKELVSRMYAHIYSRTKVEMKRIIEAPLHVDSKLNTSVQFADWICGLVARAAHFQLVQDSEFGWVAAHFRDTANGLFTHESKLHLLGSEEIHHIGVLDRKARTHLAAGGSGIGGRLATQQLAAVYAAIKR